MKKKRPPHLEDTVQILDSQNTQLTPSNISSTNKSNPSPKQQQAYFKIGGPANISTKSEHNDFDLSNSSTYEEVLTKWFGKTPHHEPLKPHVIKPSKQTQ